MYGINGLDDNEQLQKLLGFELPDVSQQEEFQNQETPPIAQGLLGGTGTQNNNQDHSHGSTAQLAAQLAQSAQSAAQGGGGGVDMLSQGHASGQQALAQQQAQQQQAGQMAMNLLIKYFTGGSAK